MNLQATDMTTLLRLMSASTLRAKVLAGNIANQNVPGFTRREVEFERLLQERIERSADLDGLVPEVSMDTAAVARPDGNNVTLENEVTAMEQNRVLYELYASILAGRMRLLESAVHGDR